MADRANVRVIPVDLIDNYHEKLFRSYDEKRMQELADSIGRDGVLTPVIVQKKDGGRYEMLSGHNRLAASKLAGVDTIPAKILESMSDEAAKDLVIESNYSQEGFKDRPISEQAMMLKHEQEKIKCQGKRTDLEEKANEANNVQEGSDGQKVQKSKTSRDAVGEMHGMNGKTVARYIKLNELIPELKVKLDDRTIPKASCFELACLSKDDQAVINEALDECNKVNEEKKHFKLGVKLARDLKKLASDRTAPLEKEEVLACFDQYDSNNDNTEEPKVEEVSLKNDLIERYFKGLDQDNINNLISRAMEEYQAANNNKDEES